MKVKIDEIKVSSGRLRSIYEMLYPETKAGIDQMIGTNKAKGNNVN